MQSCYLRETVVLQRKQKRNVNSRVVKTIQWVSFLAVIGKAQEIDLTNINCQIYTHYGIQETMVNFMTSAYLNCVLTKVRKTSSPCNA